MTRDPAAEKEDLLRILVSDRLEEVLMNAHTNAEDGHLPMSQLDILALADEFIKLVREG